MVVLVARARSASVGGRCVLAVPEPARDAGYALSEMAPAGTGGQVQQLGGDFLRGSGPQIGAVDGAVELLVPRVLT